MKKAVITLILIISTNLIFSQSKVIEEYESNFENLEHIGCVKSIFIEDSKFDENSERIDLPKTYKVKYDDQDKMIKQFYYWKNLQNPFKITTYDSLSRISKIEINREGGNGEIVIQYFKDDSVYPDSLKIFSQDMIERQKYINHFKDDIIVRRDLIPNNTLRYYTLFEYDSNNHLTKELNINTKDGFGVINKLGNSTTKTLNRNDSTLYNYKKIGDTIIINREKYKGLVVTNKTYKDDNVEINIEEQTSTNRGLTFQTTTIYKWKDSTKIENKYYKEKNVLNSYNKTFIYEDKILSKWIYPIMIKNGQAEKQEITNIERTFDKNRNWINKTFFRKNLKVKEIKRTIEYCKELN